MSTIKADAITASTGTNTNIGITGKGTGKVVLGDGNLIWPDADGSTGQYIKTDGSANLAFATPATAGMVLLSTTNASTASTVDLTGNFTSTYTSYMVKGLDIFCSSNAAYLALQMYHNGSVVTSGDYFGHLMKPTNTSASYSGETIYSASSIKILSALSSTSNQGTGFIINLLNNPTANSRKFITWSGQSAVGYNTNFGGGFLALEANSDITGLRFLTGAGTVSGKFLLYGIK